MYMVINSHLRICEYPISYRPGTKKTHHIKLIITPMKGSVDQRTQILSKKAVTSAEFSVSPMMWQLFSLILKKFAVISQKHDTL